jgi:peptidoglycan/xylan/chitin deacetylase (PgdA/CDA1 family)
MDTLFDYLPIVRRPVLRWPNGARLAVWIGLNVEAFVPGLPGTSYEPGTAGLTPDPLNAGWREYGPRVGVWRIMESLDRHGMRASVLLNADAAAAYPELIEEGKKRGWAWLAHGRTNSELWTDIPRDIERARLAAVVEAIRAATGHRPRGWLGPAMTETAHTPAILAELGVDYILDWCMDDQPFPLNVPGARMISVPYSVEVNDYGTFLTHHHTATDFFQMIVDQFDVLFQDSAASGRVMAVSLHPLTSGHPFRWRHLDRALAYLASQPDVWIATSDEIADWYLANCYDDVMETIHLRRERHAPPAQRAGESATSA